MLELRATGLRLEITEIARTTGDPENPYDFWVNCRVDVEVPGFQDAIQWSVLQAELRHLAADLRHLNKTLGTSSELTFEPTEKGVVLHLHMNPLGQIAGEYQLQDTSHGPDAPELRGFFGMDQTHLLPLASSIEQFASGEI